MPAPREPVVFRHSPSKHMPLPFTHLQPPPACPLCLADGVDEEEAGWKYIHGDVFRFPPNKSLFCSFVGTGSQVRTREQELGSDRGCAGPKARGRCAPGALARLGELQSERKGRGKGSKRNACLG